MPKSPQQINPLTPKSTPRNQKGQIIDKQSKPVGSAQAQFYEPVVMDPERARYSYLQEKIEHFRARGRLWSEPEEDPEVQEVLDEFDKLNSKFHPQLSDALSFHEEDWGDDKEQAP